MSSPSQEAAALMGRLCDGDSTAFQSFYDLCAPELFSHLLRRTSERARAVELLDAVFRGLEARRSSYVRGADPIPWLQAIAAAAYDRQRARELRATHGWWWRRAEPRGLLLEGPWAA